MDVSVVGLIIGGCILLIIILIAIVIYIKHKQKSHQYQILSIEQKETMLMKLADDENLNTMLLPRIEKSQLEIGNILGMHINF